MYKASYNKIEKENLKNYVQEKTITIDKNISVFVLLDSSEKRIWDLVMNKIVDYTIDNISSDSKNIYDSFSTVLDFLNWFLKSFKIKWEDIWYLNICIWVLEDNKLHFSKIWNSSIYLLQDSELTEVTQTSASEIKSNEFSFISSWSLRPEDIIVMSNEKLTDYLTKSDFTESVDIDSIEKTNQNLESIIHNENIHSNIMILSFVYDFTKEEELPNKYLEICKHLWLRLLDNNYSKKTFAAALVMKDKFNISDKIFRNVLFLSWIIVSISLLYIIIWWIISGTNNSMNISTAKEKLIEARDYIRVANENMNNSDLFELNIKKAEEITADIKNKKLFLNDVDKIIDDISVIKKQYDWVESFESSTSNLIYRTEQKWFNKIVQINKKTYIVNSNFILWPIVSGEKPKKYVFDKLEDDSFIDAKILSDKIVLLTKASKIVSFDKNFEFKFVNVIGQDKWEESNLIETFATNIYLLNNERNQILKHKTAVNWYSIWQWFLEDKDVKAIGKIATIAIDWGVYILKNDLSMLKLFTSPKYQLQTITLNKLPKNYKSMSPANSAIVTREDLNYVYLFINNTIFVFEPSSKRYQDVKSLTYIGQIEWKKFKIDSFSVRHDWEIDILNETWLYKLWFDVSDWRLMLK